MYEDAHNTLLKQDSKNHNGMKKILAEFQEVTNKFRSVTILTNNFGTGSVLNISVQSLTIFAQAKTIDLRLLDK